MVASRTELIRYPPAKTSSEYILPSTVTNIVEYAFQGRRSLARLTIPEKVGTIGRLAFFECTALAAFIVDALNPTYSSVDGVLFEKYQTRLLRYPQARTDSNYTVPATTTSIVEWAFSGCTNLTAVTVPNSVAVMGDVAFYGCTGLNGVYFWGNAPTGTPFFFLDELQALVYYLPGATGWSATYGSRPTVPWVLPYPVILTSVPNSGVTNDAFGFLISWATNASVVVETTADLAFPSWSPLSTNALNAGSSYFSDSDWAKFPARVYRVRWP